MSDADRERWNARYESGEYAARTHPSAAACGVDRPPPARAGPGRRVRAGPQRDSSRRERLRGRCDGHLRRRARPGPRTGRRRGGRGQLDRGRPRAAGHRSRRVRRHRHRAVPEPAPDPAPDRRPSPRRTPRLRPSLHHARWTSTGRRAAGSARGRTSFWNASARCGSCSTRKASSPTRTAAAWRSRGSSRARARRGTETATARGTVPPAAVRPGAELYEYARRRTLR